MSQHLNIPRLCISSTGGGGGKTLLSLGLGRACLNGGLKVRPFKKGPDYIDAAWLSSACRAEAVNLDPFFMDAEGLRGLFAASMLAAPAGALALIEGNRGLYDGLDESGSCSTAVVARALAAPIILCMDCAKTTRTAAALLAGLKAFEPGLAFAGVVLNRVGSSRHESSLRRAIEASLDMPVLGILPRLENNPLPERHMGLASRGRGLGDEAERRLEDIGALVAENCDIPAILRLARAAPPLCARPCAPVQPPATACRPRIGYVLDDALWFYYPDNLAALEAAGAQPVRLSLFDRGEENSRNWEGLAGLYLGGGFPEDFGAELSASPWLERIRSLAAADMPIYAECGGLMLLCEGLRRSGAWHSMAGLLAAEAEWLPAPQGLGYVEGEVVQDNPFFPKGMRFTGHEFHYSHCLWPRGLPAFALRLSRGKGLHKEGASAFDGITLGNLWAAYSHIFAPATPCWAPNFAKTAASWTLRTGQNHEDCNYLK